MRQRPELLATAANLEEIRSYIEAGADAFCIGESLYGMRMPGEFTLADIREATELCHASGKQVYVQMNNVMDNQAVEHLSEYVAEVSAAGVDAISFGDPAVLMAVRAATPQMKLHWNAEMLGTNYATANYWGKRGATRFVLARELNMDQVQEMRQNTDLELQVQVHGMTNIYHSKRSLVETYADHRRAAGKAEGEGVIVADQGQGLYLIEVERPLERFPIFEDRNGTHIMSSDDICMLENLHELMEAGIDCFKIEGILKPVAYQEAVIRAYRQAIDHYASDPVNYRFQDEWLDEIRQLQDPERELSFGFFFKEQVY